MMVNKGHIVLCILCVLSLGLNVYLWIQDPKTDTEFIEENARLKESIRITQEQLEFKKVEYVSLEQRSDSLQAVIARQEENPEIIHKKYEVIRNNIRTLNADGTIGFLSAELSKEDNH